jgi:hypothetical protein
LHPIGVILLFWQKKKKTQTNKLVLGLATGIIFETKYRYSPTSVEAMSP